MAGASRSSLDGELVVDVAVRGREVECRHEQADWDALAAHGRAIHELKLKRAGEAAAEEQARHQPSSGQGARFGRRWPAPWSGSRSRCIAAAPCPPPAARRAYRAGRQAVRSERAARGAGERASGTGACYLAPNDGELHVLDLDAN